jgi:hypothetical protein
MHWWMWPLLAWLPLATALAVLWRHPLRRPDDVVPPRAVRTPVRLSSAATEPVDRAA